MVDFSAALARKYAILQQEANAHSTLANAQARLADTQANVLPGKASAEAFQNNALGKKLNVEAGLMPAESQSNLDYRRAQIGNLNAEAGFRNALTKKTLAEQAPNRALGMLLDDQLGLSPRPAPPAMASRTSMSGSFAPRAADPADRGLMSPRRAMMPTALSSSPPSAPASAPVSAPSMTSRFGGGLPPIGSGSALQFSAGLRPPTWLEQQGVGLNTSSSGPAASGRSVDDYEREMAGRTSRPLLGLF